LNEGIPFWVWFSLMFRSFSFLCSDLFMNFQILFLFLFDFWFWFAFNFKILFFSILLFF
jgi:hypothetical protein